MKVYCHNNNWLDKEPKLTIGKMYYRFTSKYDLPSIVIDINKFHNHLLHIRLGYDYDSTWYDTKNLEKDLTKKLEDILSKSNDINVIREIKLKSLLC